MKTDAPVASHEVESFEEYTLYSLERTTPTLLQMMERSKQVGQHWPAVAALMGAGGICQEVAALACFLETLGNVFGLAEREDRLGADWRQMRERIQQVMDSLEGALGTSDPLVIKKIFAVTTPEALNSLVELIPALTSHVREHYMAACPSGAGEGT